MRRDHRRIANRQQHRGRWPRLFAAFAPILLVLAAFQISGGPHALAAIVNDTSCIDACAHDDGCGEHGCPPGCPDCVCVHGHLPSTLPVTPALPTVVLLDEFLIDLRYDDASPPPRAPTALERPPKA